MKKWITLAVVNTLTKVTEVDADSIVAFGPVPGNTANTNVHLFGGQTLVVTDSTASIRSKIKDAK